MELFVSADMPEEQKQEFIAIGAKMFDPLSQFFKQIDALGIVYSGALRGAGDTVWPGIVTAVYSWVFIVGGGWIAVTYFEELGSIGPWIAAATCIRHLDWTYNGSAV